MVIIGVEDVFRLDISMHDTLGSKVLETIQEIIDDLDLLFGMQFPLFLLFLENAKQVPSVLVLHDGVSHLFWLDEELVEINYVGVLELPQSFNLSQEA